MKAEVKYAWIGVTSFFVGFAALYVDFRLAAAIFGIGVVALTSCLIIMLKAL